MELVCNDCTSSLSVDLAVADIVKSVEELENLPAQEICNRMDILINTTNKLTTIIKKAKNEIG